MLDPFPKEGDLYILKGNGKTSVFPFLTQAGVAKIKIKTGSVLMSINPHGTKWLTCNGPISEPVEIYIFNEDWNLIERVEK